MFRIVDGNDVGRLSGGIGTHRLGNHVIELDQAVLDLDAVVLRVEFLDEIGRRLNVAIKRPDADA